MFSCYNHHRGCRMRAEVYNSYCSACIALHLTNNPQHHTSTAALPTAPSPTASHSSINSAFAAPRASSTSSRRSSFGLSHPVSPLDLHNAHFAAREHRPHHSAARYESPSAPPSTPHTSTFAPRPAELLINTSSSSSTSSPDSFSPVTPTAANPFPHSHPHIHHSSTPYSSPTCSEAPHHPFQQHQHQHQHLPHAQPYPGRSYSPLTSSFASLAGRRSLDGARVSSMGGHDDDGLAALLRTHRQRSEEERAQDGRGRPMYWA